MITEIYILDSYLLPSIFVKHKNWFPWVEECQSVKEFFQIVGGVIEKDFEFASPKMRKVDMKTRKRVTLWGEAKDNRYW